MFADAAVAQAPVCYFQKLHKNHRVKEMLLWPPPQHDFVDFQNFRIHIILSFWAAKVPVANARATFSPVWSHLHRGWHALLDLSYFLLSLLPLNPSPSSLSVLPLFPVSTLI